jgi:ketosteroid isomerase-like protein
VSETEVEAVEAANARFYGAFEGGDAEAMGDVWAVGDGVACVHPGWPMLRGRGEVLRSWALIMENTAYIQFVLTEVRTVVSGDHAVLTCEENILTGGEGDDELLAGGRVVATNVFVRGDDGWKILVHHASPVLDRG